MLSNLTFEFKDAKKEIDSKINYLEEKTGHMEEALNETLDLTTSNQQRLQSIEENMSRIVTITEELVKNKKQSRTQPDDTSGQPEPTTQ